MSRYSAGVSGRPELNAPLLLGRTFHSKALFHLHTRECFMSQSLNSSENMASAVNSILGSLTLQ